MDFITNGIDWIIAVQTMGAWLELPMRFFTYLGSEDFFFLVLPLIYWSIDAGVGIRVAFILVASNFLNSIFKLVFTSPRPYWVSTDVTPFTAEESFGVPSGHAQNSIALWGIMASGVRRRWAWAVAFLLAFLVGLSRLYLGVHFVHDVLAGWLLGGLLLLAFITWWEPVRAWLVSRNPAQQVAIAFLISLLMIALGAWQVNGLIDFVLPQEWIDNALRAGAEPAPISVEDFITSAATMFGLATGLVWIAVRGGYDASGPVEKRALRYVIGLLGVLILWMGLGAVFPRNPDLISYVLRYVRYTLVGLWVTAGAPWLFFHFKLARQPKM